MNSSWFGESLIAVILLVPVWLAISYFERNYQIKSDVFLVWYLSGVIVTTILIGRSPVNTLIPSWGTAAVIFFVGLSAGGLANVLLVRAVASAPNPGFPLAISNMSSVGVCLATVLLSRLMPTHFGSAKIDLWSFLGVVLTVIGVSLIAIRR